MYAHILTKAWVQRSKHVCTQLCKGGRADMQSKVDMHSYPDQCTHSKKGLGTDEGDWDAQKGPHRGEHISTQLYKEDGTDLEC